MIAHQIVSFISALAALKKMSSSAERRISEETEARIADANPVPTPLGSDASEEETRAYKAATSVVLDRREQLLPGAVKRALAEKLVELGIVEERGHPELPADVIVRTRTEGRCRLVKCPHVVGKEKTATGSAKKNRGKMAFCRGHVGLRRQIPRKDAFFVLRQDPTKGIQLLVAA